jgi:hypothetical protein
VEARLETLGEEAGELIRGRDSNNPGDGRSASLRARSASERRCAWPLRVRR